MNSLWTRLSNVMADRRKLQRSVVVRLASIPFRLGLARVWPGIYLAYVPDRYSVNLMKYQKLGLPSLFDGQANRWLAGNRVNNGGDLGRFYFLNLVCDQVIHEGLTGDVAELGVYRGNSAYLLADLARKLGSTAYLFDTFTGFDRRDLQGVDSEARKQFADTSLTRVKEIVGTQNTVFVEGYFPDSLSQLKSHDQRYSVVHIDCDLQAPFVAALEYFYPKLVPGGWLVMHDYSSLQWEGVERAVDEFFAHKPEKPILIPDKSGTVTIRKYAASIIP